MRSLRQIFAAASTALLVINAASCSSPPTPYLPSVTGQQLPSLGPKPLTFGETPFGYSEYEISPMMVRVRFSGNSNTEGTRAVDFALLRSAEVAIERGYPFFVVRDRVNASHSSSYTHTTPGTSFTTCDKKGRCSTTQTPPTTTRVVSHWPVYDHLIELFAEVPADGATLFVLDARFVQRALRRKYGLQMPLIISPRGTIE